MWIPKTLQSCIHVSDLWENDTSDPSVLNKTFYFSIWFCWHRRLLNVPVCSQMFTYTECTSIYNMHSLTYMLCSLRAKLLYRDELPCTQLYQQSTSGKNLMQFNWRTCTYVMTFMLIFKFAAVMLTIAGQHVSQHELEEFIDHLVWVFYLFIYFF